LSRGEYLIGCLYLAATAGAAGWVAWRFVRARCTAMAFEARVVAAALVATAVLVVAHLVPLALGILTRGTAVAAAALLGAAAWRWRPALSAGREDPRGRPSGLPSLVLGAATVLLALAYAVAFGRRTYAVAVTDFDSTAFILPVVARWMQTGSVWRFDDFVWGWGWGAYPQHGNLIQLAVELPWHDDFLLRLVAPGFMVLAGVATYAIAVELGAQRAVAGSLATAAILVPASARVGLDNGQVDAVMAGWFACGALFLVRHARTGRREELWLAGLGLGLAAGTKWYGPPEVAAVLVVWALARLLARQGRRPVLRDGVTVSLVAAAAGGFWLVRNVVVSGNPIFPARPEIFGFAPFGAPRPGRDTGVSLSILDYLGRPSAWDEIGDGLATSFGWAGLIIFLGGLAAALVALRRRDARPAALAVGALFVFVVYAALPNSALTIGGREQGIAILAAARYAMPGVLLAAAALAWLAGLRPRWAPALQVLAAAAIVHSLVEIRTVSGHFDDIRVATVVLIAALLALMALALRLLGRRRDRFPRAGLAAGALALAIAAVVAGRAVQTRFDADRYRGISAVIDRLAEAPPQPLRIAIVGGPGPDGKVTTLPAFGPRFENRVEFVGRRDDHLLSRFRDPRSFARALNSGGYDLLVVGRELDGPVPELGWALRAGWRIEVRDGPHALLSPPRA
jgi:hypothetical protein